VNVLETLGDLHQYLSKVGHTQTSSPLPVVTDDISQISTYVNAISHYLHTIDDYFYTQSTNMCMYNCVHL